MAADPGPAVAKPAPVIVFDHIKGVVFEVGGEATNDPKLAERMQPQPDVITSASGVPSAA
jgi:hypothetical protein